VAGAKIPIKEVIKSAWVSERGRQGDILYQKINEEVLKNKTGLGTQCNQE